MDLLKRLPQTTIAGVEAGVYKVGLDWLMAHTPLYQVFGRLKQGGEFVLGVTIAIILDVMTEVLLSEEQKREIERFAVIRMLYVASFVSLFEQVIPIGAKPLYLNTETYALEGYKGTVKAAYMIHDGNVYPIDLATPAIGLDSGVATYVVVTTEGVYVTTAPYILKYEVAPTPVKL